MNKKDFNKLQRGMAVTNKYDNGGISYVEELRGARVYLISNNWNGYKWCVASDIERSDSKYDITEVEVDNMIKSDPIITK